MSRIDAALVAFLITLILMFALRPVANAIGLVDRPGGRKTHVGVVPVIGGLAMYFGLLAVLPLVDPPERGLTAFLLAAGLLVLVGVGAAGGLGGLVGAGWFADRIDFNWAVIVVAAVALGVACVWALRLRRGQEPEDMAVRLGAAHLAVMGAGVLLLGGTLEKAGTLRDDLRPFARQIMQHTGPEPQIVLYKLEPRMWPFYLGLNCREVADLAELPATAKWVMVREKDAALRRQEVARRYGEIKADIAIQEPITGNAGGNGEPYRLLGFQ